MSDNTVDISVKGQKVKVQGIQVNNSTVIIKGRLLKIGQIFDEYWLEKKYIPDPLTVMETVRNSPFKPDIYTFSQRVPDAEPAFDFPLEWDNYAVLQIDSYDNWFHKQINSSARRNIRRSEKLGVVARVSEFDDLYIKGIKGIFDETPIRQGRRFWHYGKDFSTIKEENGTYSNRSLYLAAYYEGEMIGYLKIVLDQETAAIMQILSKKEFYDKRSNNALMAEAVKQCSLRGIGHLIYEKFSYNKKGTDGLTRFKQNHGFKRMDLPRYFIPLTRKGSLAVRFGLHRGIKERFPESLMSPYRKLRTRWYDWLAEM